MTTFPGSVLETALDAMAEHMPAAEAVRDPENLIIGPFVMTSVGLTTVPGMHVSLQEWMSAAGVLWSIKQGLQFAIGDFFNIGSDNWSEEYAQELDDFRYTKESIDNLMWISRRFPMSERFTPPLTHSHHVAVAGLGVDVARELLKRAIVDKLSSRDLRKTAYGILHPDGEGDGETDDDPADKKITRQLVELDAPSEIMDFISEDNMLMVTLPLSDDNVDDLRKAQKGGRRLRIAIIEELE